MLEITKNQQVLLNIFLKNKELSSSEVHAELLKIGESLSLVTVKRDLSELKEINVLNSTGGGRSIKYSISTLGRLFTNVDVKEYSAIEPDRRFGLKGFNFELLNSIPKELFSVSEIAELDKATETYKKNLKSISKILEEKELERFVIELAWKSSKIEGNTYTLLDTERLILRGVEAVGHDKHEAYMILNHKEVFKFIRENIHLFTELNPIKLEEVHKILIKNLGVEHGLRKKPVGITGSSYRPLDNTHQIHEAVISLCVVINKVSSPYTKALLSLLCISYIQPFEDGNKRTSRLMANAVLLAHDHSPLSYRSVNEDDYRNAVLAFYELNSIVSFKKIFIEQYVFAANNYAVR
jgi:Fic family protein